MEPYFAVTTVQDEDAYRSTVLADYILHQKAPTPVFYVVAILIACFLFWGGQSAAGHTLSPLQMLLSGGMALAVCVGFVPWVDRFAVKRVSARILKATLKNVKDLGSTLTYTFEEETFTLDTPSGAVTRPYDEITHLCETKRHLMLFLGRQFCFTLSKTAAPEALPFFLEAKCGVKFRLYDF